MFHSPKYMSAEHVHFAKVAAWPCLGLLKFYGRTYIFAVLLTLVSAVQLIKLVAACIQKIK